MKKDNIFLAIWRCGYPMLLHLAMTFVVIFGYMFLIAFWIGLNSFTNLDVTGITEQITESYMEHALILLLVTSGICIPIFALLYRADERKREKSCEKETSKWAWALLVVLAVTLCVSLNLLVGMSGLEKLSKSYQDVATTLYSGGFVVEIITVGILGPICEELVFRAMMFRRLCGYVKPIFAIVISALMFGIYHGNIVQGVYAFLLGVIMALCYEYFKTLWAPILIHVVANIVSVCITEITILGNTLGNRNVSFACAIGTTLIWILIMVYFMRKNKRK